MLSENVYQADFMLCGGRGHSLRKTELILK